MSHTSVHLHDAGSAALLCVRYDPADHGGAAHLVGQPRGLVPYVPRVGQLWFLGGEMHAVALFGPILLLRLQTTFSRTAPDLLLLSNSTGTKGPSWDGGPAPGSCT